MSLAFAGTVTFEDIDVAGYKARVKAQGADAKGRGGAHALSTFQVQPAGSGSKVLVHTDLALSGAVAQYGRGIGMIQTTAAQLMRQFADCLQAQLARTGHASDAKEAASSAADSPRPISGFALLAKVIWRGIVELFTGRSRRS